MHFLMDSLRMLSSTQSGLGFDGKPPFVIMAIHAATVAGSCLR